MLDQAAVKRQIEQMGTSQQTRVELTAIYEQFMDQFVGRSGRRPLALTLANVYRW